MKKSFATCNNQQMEKRNMKKIIISIVLTLTISLVMLVSLIINQTNIEMQTVQAMSVSYEIYLKPYFVESEVEYFIDDASHQSQTQTFTHTRIYPIGETERTHDNSLVIVLMGDGFTEEDYGIWNLPNPNPASNTVLWHAQRAISALMNTYPFNMFTHLFMVYVVHVHGVYTHEVAGDLYYLGTNDGQWMDILGWTTRQYRIRELANNLVACPSYINMIQIITNSRGSTNFPEIGHALMDWDDPHAVNIAVTSIRNGSVPIGGSNSVWPRGTAWHGTFIHEFGHTFGNLVDEHSAHRIERPANHSRAENENLKWRHWFGHRNVSNNPRRFYHWSDIDRLSPMAVPSINNGCIMIVCWANRDFCGVCRAELTYRLALVSGETFLGVGYNAITGLILPLYEEFEIPQGATRILDSAFHGNTILQVLTIPPTIATIGDFAFLGATGLRVIRNYSTTPQEIDNTTFATSGTMDNVQNGMPNALDRSQIRVYIPAGTYSAYRAAGWTGFALVDASLIIENDIVIGFIEPPNFDGHIGIPHTVTQIANNAFEWFMGNKIAIPSSVTVIGENAFANQILIF